MVKNGREGNLMDKLGQPKTQQYRQYTNGNTWNRIEGEMKDFVGFDQRVVFKGKGGKCCKATAKPGSQ